MRTVNQQRGNTTAKALLKNWHLTLRLVRLSLRGGINMPSTECLSFSGMIVNDNNCTVCIKLFMLDILESVLAEHTGCYFSRNLALAQRNIGSVKTKSNSFGTETEQSCSTCEKFHHIGKEIKTEDRWGVKTTFKCCHKRTFCSWLEHACSSAATVDFTWPQHKEIFNWPIATN